MRENSTDSKESKRSVPNSPKSPSKVDNQGSGSFARDYFLHTSMFLFTWNIFNLIYVEALGKYSESLLCQVLANLSKSRPVRVPDLKSV